jgi:hypothetical protein
MLYKQFIYKIFLLAFCISTPTVGLLAQPPETENKTEQAFENLADNTETEDNDDDNYLQFLENKKNFKIDLNKASFTDLKEFYFINDIQANAFIQYRKKLGYFISVYELQAIPYWDAETVRKILPFATVNKNTNLIEAFSDRWRNGSYQFVTRVTRIAEISRGYTLKPPQASSYYLGSPERVFFRAKYNYKNLLQYGILGEKDAGEQFKFGKKQLGFDSYSFHFQLNQVGKIEKLIIGDYTVNMAQGLASYQGLAFKKSADATAIKRQGNVIRPYLSAGEFNFQRGAALTLQLPKHLHLTVFGGIRKRDANTIIDTLNNEDFFSSLQTSGLHRTNAELNDKNAIQTITGGTHLQYKTNNLQIGLQGIYYNFNKPFKKADDPYNAFAISGTQWGNASVDYSYNWRNLHFFGEVASDYKQHFATVQGLLASLDKKADFALLYRNINKKYQALNANAFTENVLPNNESGLYTGLVLRPLYNVRIDAYADLYKFPFLKNLTNAPTVGNDYMVQINWKYKKQAEAYVRFRTEAKPRNITNDFQPIYEVTNQKRSNMRLHIAYKLNSVFTVKLRTEAVWFNQGALKETGALLFFDLNYKPVLQPLNFSTRLQIHETSGYNSRIYAYENDVLYSFSIPAFFGKGARYYLNANYDWRINKKNSLTLYARLAQTIFNNLTKIGSGLDEINGNRRTEIKLQLVWNIK